MHTYSFDEQVVGTWVDGKPVYEKTYFVDNLVRNDTWQTVATITSFKRLVKISATFYNSSIQGGVNYQLSRNQPQLQITNAGVIQYAIVAATGMTDFYLTVRYTKTTD